MGSEDLRCAMNESREGALPLPQGKTEFVERVIPRELSCQPCNPEPRRVLCKNGRGRYARNSAVTFRRRIRPEPRAQFNCATRCSNERRVFFGLIPTTFGGIPARSLGF